MDGQYYNLWSTDNDKTDGNDDVVIKSVYDPSPVGYSLPASNAFTGFTNTGQNIGNWTNPVTPEDKAKLNVKGNFNKGWHFYTKSGKTGIPFYFPASGFRNYDTGSLGNVSAGGYYWVACPSLRHHGRFLDFDSVVVYPLSGFPRSSGMPVRSAEEKK